MTLTQTFDKYGTDKGSSGHDLGGIYEPYFKGRNIKRAIEIGVYKGASVNAFADYFGPDSKIVGIDVNNFQFDKLPNVTVAIGDATNPEFMQSVLGMFEGRQIDFVLDDASHRIQEQIATLHLLVYSIVPDGLYIVEDVRMDDAGTLLTSLPDCVKIIGWYRYPRMPNMVSCILRKR